VGHSNGTSVCWTHAGFCFLKLVFIWNDLSRVNLNLVNIDNNERKVIFKKKVIIDCDKAYRFWSKSFQSLVTGV
jgi:hypothetical protein